MQESILERALRRWKTPELALGPGDAGVILSEHERLCMDEDMTTVEAAARMGIYLEGLEAIEQLWVREHKYEH